VLSRIGRIWYKQDKTEGANARADGAEMTGNFFERPILNSPYEYPGRHWELDAEGQPTNRIIETRRRSKGTGQAEVVFRDCLYVPMRTDPDSHYKSRDLAPGDMLAGRRPTLTRIIPDYPDPLAALKGIEGRRLTYRRTH
jgi:hypothetical protein